MLQFIQIGYTRWTLELLCMHNLLATLLKEVLVHKIKRSFSSLTCSSSFGCFACQVWRSKRDAKAVVWSASRLGFSSSSLCHHHKNNFKFKSSQWVQRLLDAVIKFFKKQLEGQYTRARKNFWSRAYNNIFTYLVHGDCANKFGYRSLALNWP
jgi:hypothetical protein